MYGKPPGPIKPDIMKKVLGPKWKEEIIECRPSDLIKPMWDQRKNELKEIDGGAYIKKEEDGSEYQYTFDEVKDRAALDLMAEKEKDVQRKLLAQLREKYNVVIHNTVLSSTESTEEK